jgi:hypothetical protein
VQRCSNPQDGTTIDGGDERDFRPDAVQIDEEARSSLGSGLQLARDLTVGNESDENAVVVTIHPQGVKHRWESCRRLCEVR